MSPGPQSPRSCRVAVEGWAFNVFSKCLLTPLFSINDFHPIIVSFWEELGKLFSYILAVFHKFPSWELSLSFNQRVLDLFQTLLKRFWFFKSVVTFSFLIIHPWLLFCPMNEATSLLAAHHLYCGISKSHLLFITCWWLSVGPVGNIDSFAKPRPLDCLQKGHKRQLLTGGRSRCCGSWRSRGVWEF